MKIGFYSAVFPDLPIEAVADWAAGEGFDCLEIDFNRHIGDSANVEKVVGTVRKAGLEVSSITLFGVSPDLRSKPARQNQGNSKKHGLGGLCC